MGWDDAFGSTQSELGSLYMERLYSRLFWAQPKGMTKPWLKWLYRHHVTLDCAERGESVLDLKFDRFQPQRRWWVSTGYSKLHFHFRSADDAMLFRMSVL